MHIPRHGATTFVARCVRVRALAPLLLLCGCTSMVPPAPLPALPVPAQFSTADTQQGMDAAGTTWRDYFTDPALHALITQALAHNRDLRLAVLRTEEARAALGLERSAALPTVGLQAQAERSRTPADLSLTRRPLLADTYQAGLGVAAWEIDFWGRVRSLEDAALQTWLATDEARRAATLALVAQVADTYLGLRELEERLRIANQTVASREETLRITTRRLEAGATSRLNRTQVQTLLLQARALAVQLEQSLALQQHALRQLTGTEPATTSATPPAVPAPPFDEAYVLGPLRAGLPSAVLVQRPDIIAAEHQLRAAHARIGAARAAFFPRITLTGSLGMASAELDGLFRGTGRAWRFAPSLALPIFDAGRNQANLDLAEVRRDQAVAHYESAVQQAFREVADALSARRWLAEQLGVQQQALAVQRERARLSQLRHDHGAAAFLDVLDAQRDLLATEQQLVQVRRALLSSQVRLYAALGGGTQALPAPTPAPAIPSP